MKVAVVLGNRMQDDGSFSEIMKKRLALTLELNEKMSPDLIICSGGLANPAAGVTEASAMKTYLVKMGLPENKVVEENRSMTTKDNAFYSMKIIEQYPVDTIIVCSSLEHFTDYSYHVLGYFKDNAKKEYTYLVYTR
jgi:vancomycin permeability regulator SanA